MCIKRRINITYNLHAYGQLFMPPNRKIISQKRCSLSNNKLYIEIKVKTLIIFKFGKILVNILRLY
jgi:hypothetical protein